MSEVSDVQDDEHLLEMSDQDFDTEIDDLNDFKMLKQTVKEGKMRESINKAKEQE